MWTLIMNQGTLICEMLGNSETLFASRVVKSWILESARPGLHSDSAPYHREVWGKKLKVF